MHTMALNPTQHARSLFVGSNVPLLLDELRSWGLFVDASLV